MNINIKNKSKFYFKTGLNIVLFLILLILLLPFFILGFVVFLFIFKKHTKSFVYAPYKIEKDITPQSNSDLSKLNLAD
jgi:hypothetical protein